MTRRRILIGSTIALAVLLVAAFFVVRQRRQASAASQYETFKAETGDLTSVVGATGTVRAYQTAVLNWQSTGTVSETNAKIGDRVSEDEILASLEPSSLPQNVILAKADLVDAQRALDELLKSQTAAAQAQVAMLAAQTALSDAQTKVESFKYKRASQEQLENAQANVALAQDKMDEAHRTIRRKTHGGPRPTQTITLP
jgi:HlyD family secretion protein